MKFNVGARWPIFFECNCASVQVRTRVNECHDGWVREVEVCKGEAMWVLDQAEGDGSAMAGVGVVFSLGLFG